MPRFSRKRASMPVSPLLEVLAHLRTDSRKYGIRLPSNGVPVVVDIEGHTAAEIPVAPQIGTKINTRKGLVAEGVVRIHYHQALPDVDAEIEHGLAIGGGKIRVSGHRPGRHDEIREVSFIREKASECPLSTWRRW